MLVASALSALLNVVALAGLPFLVYYAYQRRRYKRSFAEIARRAGLQLGEGRYLGYCVLFAAATVAVLVIWPPSLEPMVREGSGFEAFDGLGLGPVAVVMALLYGLIKTGFAEELLFRGLIAGSLSRRLSVGWADLLQAVLFLVPHLLVLSFMPEAWGILPVVFAGALFVGWVRIKSGSILGPWLVHATANVTMALSIAMRTAP